MTDIKHWRQRFGPTIQFPPDVVPTLCTRQTQSMVIPRNAPAGSPHGAIRIEITTRHVSPPASDFPPPPPPFGHKYGRNV